MTIALDVGSRRFRSLRRNDTHLAARTCPAACCFLPDKPPVRHLLEQSGVRFGSTRDQLAIWGSSAENLAKLCAVKTEHLLARNPLRKDNHTIREPLGDVLSSVLPSASAPGEICCLGSLSDDFHADWLRGALDEMGYQIATCSAGLALVLAEMVREKFTGLGLVFGAGRCEAVLARDGKEIARCELPRGGDAIDQAIAIAEDRYWWSMAGFRELDTEGITAWKESLDMSVLEPANARGERLLAGYHQLAAELCSLCESTFSRHELPGALAVVAGGGAVRAPGFSELLEQHLGESSLPIAKDKTRIAAAEHTIVRGLLIYAELEQRAQIQAA